MVQAVSKLKGRTIAVTRPCGQSEEAGDLIQKWGGTPYFIPAIEIKSPGDLSPIKKFLDELLKGEVDYVIFMSVNGVKRLLSAAESLGQLAELEEGMRKTVMMAVGPKTAQELKVHQFHVSLVPEKYSSEGLVQSLKQLHVSGKSIRIPRTTEANPVLTEKLKEMGGLVQEVHVYESALPVDQTLREKFLLDLGAGKIQAVIFGSSQCVKNLFQMLDDKIPMEKLREEMNSRLTIVAIGSPTAKTLAEMGVKVDVMPVKYLFEEALSALARYWNTR